MFAILVINPGSTSTKIAMFHDKECAFSYSISHDSDELAVFGTINDQTDFRINAIKTVLHKEKIELERIDAFVGRGGLLKPISSGTFTVDANMLDDLQKGVLGQHASNLGGIIAHRFAEKYSKPAYIVDPVVVDELQDIARLSGHPLLPRKSIFHALNQKSVARQAAATLGKSYESCNLIIAHLGGGISVGAHHNGRVIDVNNALNGEGPFSPERSGTLPAADLVDICFSGKYTRHEIQKMIKGAGGIVGYLGVNDLRKVNKMLEKEGPDSFAHLVYRAMVYQIAKEIGCMAAVLKGKVDAIVLTGGITQDQQIVKLIADYVSFLGVILTIPGEEEMSALAAGALKVLKGEEKAKNYKDSILENDLNF